MRTPGTPALVERFRELIEQLGANWGFKHGWQTKAANALGIHVSDLTKIRNGDRRPGWELANQVARRMSLSPSFFSAPSGAHFTNYVLLEADADLSLAPSKGLRWNDVQKRAAAILEPVRSGMSGAIDPTAAKQLAQEVLDMNVALRARAVLQASPDELQSAAHDLAFGVLLDGATESLERERDEARKRAVAAERRVAEVEAELQKMQQPARPRNKPTRTR